MNEKKSISITKDTYDLVAAAAEQEFRTVEAQVAWILNQHFTKAPQLWYTPWAPQYPWITWDIGTPTRTVGSSE